MKWEIDSEMEEKAVCVCGKGFVSRTVVNESDGWNRYNRYVRDEKIECSACSEKYHIEHRVFDSHAPSWKHEGLVDETYLVPNGKTINLTLEHKPLPYEQFIRFEDRVVAKHSKEEIVAVIQDMQESRYSTRLSNDTSRDVLADWFRAHKSRKLDSIIPVLEKCLENYDTYEWTHSKVLEYRKKEKNLIQYNQEILQQTLEQSYKLSFV